MIMSTEKTTSVTPEIGDTPPVEIKSELAVQPEAKTEKRRKRKYNSAGAAAAKGENAVEQTNATSYKDGNFGHTGSNLTYREGQD
jgi:hypothetical protein